MVENCYTKPNAIYRNAYYSGMGVLTCWAVVPHKFMLALGTNFPCLGLNLPVFRLDFLDCIVCNVEFFFYSVCCSVSMQLVHSNYRGVPVSWNLKTLILFTPPPPLRPGLQWESACHTEPTLPRPLLPGLHG